jgi:hypothetical protein
MASMKTKTKWWAIAVILIYAVFAGGYFEAGRVDDHFLANGTLTRLIGRKTAEKLEADAGYLPLIRRGLVIHSDGILVPGKPPRSLTQMSAANIRAYCSLENIWRRKWTVRRLQVSHLEAAFGHAGEAHLQKILPRDPELQPPLATTSPISIEIRETFVPQTDIFWGETPEVLGYLKDVEARYPSDHSLDALARGGTFGQNGLARA